MYFPKVSIIILNWNGWEDSIECLESLYAINYPRFDIIIVDNDSSDDSVIKIKDYCKGKIKVNSQFFKYNPNNKPISIYEIQSEINPQILDKIRYQASNREIILLKNNKNDGYAGGNNIGIKFEINNLKSDYILILNNDIVVHEDFLDELLNVAKNKANCGIVSPKTYFYFEPDKLQYTWNRINYFLGKVFLVGSREIDSGKYEKVIETDYAPGSCMLIKKEIIQKIGLFNHKYNFYWEETEYCIRANKIGYKSFYCPKAKVWHKVSQSTIKNKGLSDYYHQRNRFWFFKTYGTTIQYICFLMFFFLFDFWFSLIKNIIFNYSSFYFIKGTIDGITNKD